jgi:hypothetical protein
MRLRGDRIVSARARALHQGRCVARGRGTALCRGGRPGRTPTEGGASWREDSHGSHLSLILSILRVRALLDTPRSTERPGRGTWHLLVRPPPPTQAVTPTLRSTVRCWWIRPPCTSSAPAATPLWVRRPPPVTPWRRSARLRGPARNEACWCLVACVVLASCLRRAFEAGPCCAEKRFEPAGYEHLVFGHRAPGASASAGNDECHAATAQRPVDREHCHALSLAVTNLARAATCRATLRSLVPPGAAAHLLRLGETCGERGF